MCERFLTLLSLNWPMGGLAALFDRQRTCVPLSSCRSQDRIPSDIALALYSVAMNRRCPCQRGSIFAQKDTAITRSPQVGPELKVPYRRALASSRSAVHPRL